MWRPLILPFVIVMKLRLPAASRFRIPGARRVFFSQNKELLILLLPKNVSPHYLFAGRSSGSRFILRRAFPPPFWVAVALCAFVCGYSCGMQPRIFTGFPVTANFATGNSRLY
jgi:hypothetical protein